MKIVQFASRRINMIALVVLAAPSPAQARAQIRIVGSSTVFPFATAVADRGGRELPIGATYCVWNVDLDDNQRLALARSGSGDLVWRLEDE